MKKKIFLIPLIILLIISLASCGVYKPPIIPDNPYDDDPTNPPGGGTTKPNPDDDKLVFTVTLYSEGRRFSPNVTFYAQWTSADKTEIVNAPFNALGVATTDKLDGEYRVTLSGLPSDYTYDPNGIFVDNDHRDAVVELLPIIQTKNNGTNYGNDCIEVEKLGTYQHEFRSRDDKAWYRFRPTAQGKYVIESWVDVSENEINPVMIHYYGNSAGYVNEDYPADTYDGGGTSSTYSKNFRFELELSGSMVQNVWYFQLYAECKGEYPVKIDFTIKLIGDYSGTEEVFDPVIPAGPFLKTQPSGTWTYNYRDNNKVLDSSRFRLHSNGFYYLYDEVAYASNGGWGPMLFAKLSKDNEIMVGNNEGDAGGFGNPLVRLKFDGKDYTTFMKTYFAFCNNEGAHPVNKELKDFLQHYASSQSLFADGERDAELFMGLTAAEEDMWLFACGYYK